MQALLAEKDAELAELRERVERIEARRGAMEELRALNEQTAQLKVFCPCFRPPQARGLFAAAQDSTLSCRRTQHTNSRPS